MDDLHVDGELLSAVVEDKDTNAAAARLKGTSKTTGQVGLVNDLKTLLDVTSLGHGNDAALLEIKDAVLLEDGAEHGLDDDAGGRVGNEGGLLVQLLGEEVDTEVAVLTSGRGGGDADDLARAALEHQEVAEADVMAGDGNSVGDIGAAGATRAGTGGCRLLVDVDVHVVVVLMAARVGDAVSQLVDALAEGVVVTWSKGRSDQQHGQLTPTGRDNTTLTILVVVTHLGFLVGYGVADWFNSFVGDACVLRVVVMRVIGNTRVNGEFVDVHAVVVEVLSGGSVDSRVVLRMKAFTVLTFGNVNGAGEGLYNVDVDVSLCVFRTRFRSGKKDFFRSV